MVMVNLLATGLLVAQGNPCMPLVGVPGPSSLGINSSQTFINLGQQRMEREICQFQNPTPLLQINPDPQPDQTN
ncbi:MAG: hypothetical protein Q6K90_02565 [Gloeomargarita sp. HHBFW_bins_162]